MLPIELATVIEKDEDREYVEQLYEKNKKYMYIAAYKMLHDESESWGAVHDAIIVVTDYLDEMKGWTEKHQTNFMCKCTRIFACNELRRQGKVNENSIWINDSDNAPEIDVPDDSITLEDMYIKEETSKRIEEAIEKMDPRYSEMLYLKYYMNMRNVEIARSFKLKIGTVNMRMSRAMAQLRKLLEGKV